MPTHALDGARTTERVTGAKIALTQLLNVIAGNHARPDGPCPVQGVAQQRQITLARPGCEQLVERERSSPHRHMRRAPAGREPQHQGAT